MKLQNYPHPFNPNTNIAYELPGQSHATLKVFDVLGREVATLGGGVQEPGDKSVDGNASHFPSGIYFCRLEATSVSSPRKTLTQVKKMVLLR